MITITFTYAGTLLPTGRYAVHLYVQRENDGEFDMSPRAEKLAMDDAEYIIHDLMRENDPDNDERLLKKGQPPLDAVIIAQSRISVRWDRNLQMATYHRAGYERLAWEGKWQPVAALMMEQYDYIFGILRRREKLERKEKLKRYETHKEKKLIQNMQ